MRHIHSGLQQALYPVMLILSFCAVLPISSKSDLRAQARSVIQLDSSGYLSLPLGDFPSPWTMEVWVYPLSNNQNGDILSADDKDTVRWAISLTDMTRRSSGNFAYLARPKQQPITASAMAMPANQWTHIAITRTGSAWKVYKNGMLSCAGIDGGVLPVTSLRLGQNFKGRMTQFRLWSRELSGADVKLLMADTLQGDETGLVGCYDLFQVTTGQQPSLVNRARGNSHLSHVNLIDVHANPQYIQCALPFSSLTPKAIYFRHVPQHLQFLPRDARDSAWVLIDGMVQDWGVDSLLVELFRNDTLLRRTYLPMTYDGRGAWAFSHTVALHSELSQYTIRVYQMMAESRVLVHEADDIVVGDAYIICGQSNSHPSDTSVHYQSPFLRTLGIQTSNSNFGTYDPADTLWGYANAHGCGQYFTGPYLTGVWGLYLQQMIEEKYHIPICVINGGTGASTIEQNIRNDQNPTDLTTVYGRALYRSQKAGLANHFKALFWHQGESNTIKGYYSNFKRLYTSWTDDYPSVKKFYVFQVRPSWCGAGETGLLRNLQRSLDDSLPNIRLMSTVALPNHDGCHYKATGYMAMAESIFRLVDHDFYGARDTANILPPKLDRVFYTSTSQKEIAITFHGFGHGLKLSPDVVVDGHPYKLQEYFYLDQLVGHVSSIRVAGDTVLLELLGSDTAKKLTYCPDQYFNGTKTTFGGLSIQNSRGVGIFTFANVPIEPPAAVSSVNVVEPAITDLTSYPNPCTNAMRVRFQLRVPQHVRIEIVDELGRSIEVDSEGEFSPGIHDLALQLHFALKSQSGAYFLRIETPTTTMTLPFVRLAN